MFYEKKQYDSITEQIIRCAIEVHKELGPGLMESVYDICLAETIQNIGLRVERQHPVPITFKGKLLDKSFIIDQLVENEIVLELKSVEMLLPVHEAQLLTYLKLSGKKLGLLINFNVALLKDGIRRRVNGRLSI